MGNRVVGCQVVDVARADQRQPGIRCQRSQHGVDPRLDVDLAVLQLDVHLVLAEDLHQPVELAAGPGVVAVDQRLADATGQAARQGNDAVGVGGELLEVDPRLVPVAVEVARGHQPDQVVVPLRRLGQQRQVSALLALHARCVVVDHVDLTAEDRLDALLRRRPRQLDGSGHRAVVGEADRGHPQVGRAGHQWAHPARPVEDRILAVDVEVDVRQGVGHSLASLLREMDGTAGRRHRDPARSSTRSGLVPGAKWILMDGLPASAAAAGCDHGRADQPDADGGDATGDRQPAAALLARPTTRETARLTLRRTTCLAASRPTT